MEGVSFRISRSQRRKTGRLRPLCLLVALLQTGCPAPDDLSVDDTAPHSVPDSDPKDTPSTDSAPADTSPLEDTSADEPKTPENLLENPSFEEGESPWNIWGGATRVEKSAKHGAWALQATNGNGAEQLVEQLEPNTTYRLSGWGKTEDSTPMTIGVKFHGYDETNIPFSSSTYTEAAFEFTTGFGNTTAIIYAYKDSGEAPGFADNLSLTAVGPSAYALVWSDEFDGKGALDPNKWNFEEGFVRNEELQWYQQDNAFQEDGYLIIEGRQESKPNPNYDPGSSDWRTSRENIEYTSSSVTTADLFEWQYGRAVVRAKVTNHAGTWPAIWTLGTDCEWPSNGEVDIMENYGGYILANFAWGTNQRWSAEWDASYWPVSDWEEGWVDDFHIWELEWTADQMTILLDGDVLNSVLLSETINGSSDCADQNPFQQPHYLLLNLALGGSAGGSVEGLSFPTRYIVDYVRIYQYPETYSKSGDAQRSRHSGASNPAKAPPIGTKMTAVSIDQP